MTTHRSSSHQHELLLAIGGVVGHLDIRGGNDVFLEQLRARYGAFLLPLSRRARRDFSLRLDLTSAAAPGAVGPRGSPADNPLRVGAAGRQISIDRWDIQVRLRAAAAGRRPEYRGRGACAMNPFAVDCILRVVWASLLPRVDGLLVHGCGLRHAEVAFVFPGQSGAGKTTLARKAPRSADVLSDELCVVRRSEDGWRVHGTPFWGDFARGGISMRSWPLRTIAFLAQAPHDTVRMNPIVSSDATLRLLGCFLGFTTDRATVTRNLALALKLCAEVRSVEASLTRNVPARDIFRRLGPHLGPEVTRKVPPSNAREMISEFRSFLHTRRSYTFTPKPAATRSWLKGGGALLIESVGSRQVGDDDILLYWRPGATPEGDSLICRAAGATRSRRLVADDAEVLGRVAVVARDGTRRPLTKAPAVRISDLEARFGALVAEPILRTVIQ